MDLGHTIMSMIGGMPSRVMCRTCKSEHNYKPKKGVKEPGAASASSSGTRTPRAPKAEKPIPVELEWMKQINSNARAIRPYAANEYFTPGDRISHPSFGEGVIQKHIVPHKIEVLFRMDLKVLIHSGNPAN